MFLVFESGCEAENRVKQIRWIRGVGLERVKEKWLRRMKEVCG